MAALLVLLPQGVSLWLHYVLLFGASGSVWGYGRVADLICSLCRVLLAIFNFHFVDDFTGIEPKETCGSGCDAFEELNRLLGLRTKPRKRISPRSSLRRLGATFTLAGDQLVLSPCAVRARKLARVITTVIELQQLPPVLAARLAGKLSFLVECVFGRIGRALLKALYARQHATARATALTVALRQSLRALIEVIHNTPPKVVSLRVSPGAPRWSMRTLASTSGQSSYGRVHRRDGLCIGTQSGSCSIMPVGAPCCSALGRRNRCT